MVCVSSHGQWLVLCHWRSRTPSRSTDPYHGVRRRLSFAVPCRRSFRLETPTGNLLGFDAAAGWRSRAARPPAPNGRAFGGSTARNPRRPFRSRTGPARRSPALGPGRGARRGRRRGCRRRATGPSRQASRRRSLPRQRRGDRNLDAVDGRVRHDQDEEGRRPGRRRGRTPPAGQPPAHAATTSGTRGRHGARFPR